MTGRLAGKKAYVTGGASGIGRATALRFAEEGADVFIADLAEQPGLAVCEEIRTLGRLAGFARTDVMDEQSVERSVAAAVSEIGGMDILFASAGVSHANYTLGEAPGGNKLIPIVDLPFDNFSKIIAINLNGMFLQIRAAAREMLKAGRGGRIITVASAAVRKPPAGMAGYNASKSGVWALTNTLAKELAHAEITCNTIGPGNTLTPMLNDYVKMVEDGLIQRTALLSRWGEPVDIANTAVFLASEDGRMFTGHIFFPDGGSTMH